MEDAHQSEEDLDRRIAARVSVALLAGGAGAFAGFFVAGVLGVIFGMSTQWKMLFIDGESALVIFPLCGATLCFIIACFITPEGAARLGLAIAVGSVAMYVAWGLAGHLWGLGLRGRWFVADLGNLTIMHILPAGAGPLGFLLSYCFMISRGWPATGTNAALPNSDSQAQ